jgi:hypothetical protein
MGRCPCVGPAGAGAATVYDRPAVKRKEHHGLVAGGTSGFGVSEIGQFREHGAVVMFVGG